MFLSAKYRQYYDGLNYDDDDFADRNIAGWTLVSELNDNQPEQQQHQENSNQNNVDDEDEDYFDVEYLASKEKVETMLPNNKHQLGFDIDAAADCVSEESSPSPNEPTEQLLDSFEMVGAASRFVRSHQNRSSVRSLRRRSAKFRQVRFQPIPQSIDISIQSEESTTVVASRNNDDDDNDDDEAANNKLSAPIASRAKKLAGYKPKHLKRKVTRKLNLSNLGHMNSQLNKITLKSFNNLAQRFHQMIGSTRASSVNFEASSHEATVGSHTRRDEQSGEHETIEPNDDDIGWGSDFDDQSADSSLTITSGGQQQSEQQQQQSSGYLLEIGKASQDTKAVRDVIHGQGISGQFKRLDTSAEEQQLGFEKCTPVDISSEQAASRECNQAVESAERNEDLSSTSPDTIASENCSTSDEEAELRSLEDRQGFKQIRDKLKIIFDQRLVAERANFQPTSQSAAPSAGQQPENMTTFSPLSAMMSSCGLPGAAGAEQSNGDEADEEEAERPPSKVDSDDGQASVGVSSSCEPAAADVVVAGAASCGHRLGEAIAKGGCKQSAGEFDCQSHCSDDSNHSGSQDSGHSTQHSAYSSSSQLMNHRLLCSTADGTTATISQEQQQQQQQADQKRQQIVQQINRSPDAQTTHDDDDSGDSADQEQRKSRFMQNRLIINNKLESMFRSRSGGGLAERSATLRQQPERKTRTETKPTTTQSAPSSPPKPSQQQQQQQTNDETASVAPRVDEKSTTAPPTTIETTIMLMNRQLLLEQQRWMSLKLKQKPRRKAANRQWLNDDMNSNLSNQPSATITTTTPAPTTTTTASTTSQISMIQASSISSYNNNPVRPALSLRQLVKDVIDDYEPAPVTHQPVLL